MKALLAGLLLLASAIAQAQEAAAPEAESTGPQSASETAVSETAASEREALEPAVPSAVLAAEVRRDADGEQVMDRLELGRTEVTGNQELPKVLYIVPWQKSDPGDLTGKPVNTLLDEVMAPVDRTEFLRQVEYYNDLYGGTTE